MTLGKADDASSMIYRGFPLKLHHDLPSWVEPGALFHIRIRVDRKRQKMPLTTASIATPLLNSAKFYQEKEHWYYLISVDAGSLTRAVIVFT